MQTPSTPSGDHKKGFSGPRATIYSLLLRLMKLEPSVLGAESLSRETQGQLRPTTHTGNRESSGLGLCSLPAEQREGDSGETLIIITCANNAQFLQFKFLKMYMIPIVYSYYRLYSYL